jgi:hypothetical protein
MLVIKFILRGMQVTNDEAKCYISNALVAQLCLSDSD